MQISKSKEISVCLLKISELDKVCKELEQLKGSNLHSNNSIGLHENILDTDGSRSID